MDRVQAPGELGFMILSDDGRLIDSGGDLKNKDKIATVIHQMRQALDASASVINDTIHCVTIQYKDHLYVVVFETKRSLVVKRRKSLITSTP